MPDLMADTPEGQGPPGRAPDSQPLTEGGLTDSEIRHSLILLLLVTTLIEEIYT